MSLQVLKVTNAAIDLALEPEKGGDVIAVPVTVPTASPAVFTVTPGAAAYVPTNGDAVKLGGGVPGGFSAGTTYYVVSASAETFELSATKGGGAINASSDGVATQAYISSKEEVAAVNCPFKPNYSVVVANLTAGSLVLQDSDDNSSFGTLATVGAGVYANVQLRKRYIKVSTSATLYLLGN